MIEVLEAIGRRAGRGRGRELPRVLSPAAAAFARGSDEANVLTRLGPLDPYVSSWALEDGVLSEVTRPTSPPGRSRSHRGVFRETWRASLDVLRPSILALGERAAANGVLERPDDVFFLPDELLDSLEGEERPGWVDHAVLRNRGEYFQLLRSADPAEARAWARAPLTPLP